MAQFVVPFHQFPHHARLVEKLLRPIDVIVAAAFQAAFQYRCAAGSEQDRYVLARGVVDAVDGVGGSQGDVHHHGLHTPGRHVVAVRHRHRDIFMRNQQGPWIAPAGFFRLGLGERFYKRCEIGSCVGE